MQLHRFNRGCSYLKLLPVPAQMLHCLGLNSSAIHAILAVQKLDYVPYRVSDSAIIPTAEPKSDGCSWTQDSVKAPGSLTLLQTGLGLALLADCHRQTYQKHNA